jgi:hypothetical protein
LSDAEADAISRLGRGEAVWRVGDLSLVARHLVPPGMAELVNTDQYMHRDTHLDPNAEALSDAA